MKLRNALWKRNHCRIPDQHTTTAAITHSSSLQESLVRPQQKTKCTGGTVHSKVEWQH